MVCWFGSQSQPLIWLVIMCTYSQKAYNGMLFRGFLWVFFGFGLFLFLFFFFWGGGGGGVVVFFLPWYVYSWLSWPYGVAKFCNFVQGLLSCVCCSCYKKMFSLQIREAYFIVSAILVLERHSVCWERTSQNFRAGLQSGNQLFI